MSIIIRIRPLLAITVATALTGSLQAQFPVQDTGCIGGCGSMMECHRSKLHTWCAPIPPLPPNGESVRSYSDLQAYKGSLDRFFIYPNEWYLGGKTLGPFGRRHVQKLANELSNAPGFAFMVPIDEPKLDAARRSDLVAALRAAGLDDAEARVKVADSKAEGLYGAEAVLIYPRFLMSGMRSGQNMGGSGGGSLSGFGGATGGSSSGFGGGFGGRGY